MKARLLAGLAASIALAVPASAQADAPICHNGVLSDDAGQNCADGLYEQVYGGGSGTTTPAAAPTASSTTGSSNPYVDPACESGGNPQVYDPSGTYWGKYQFDRRTWIASGGSAGSYGSAGEAEQDRVAANVHYDAWPNC